jgi:hypothetical protein
VLTVQAKFVIRVPIAHRAQVRYHVPNLAVVVDAICQLQLRLVHCSALRLSVR